MLHLLAQHTGALDASLHVAHLDHMLRGIDSAADARYVEGLAGRLGIPALIEARDVRAYQQKHRLSLEEAARHVRYQFYCDVARTVGARRVLLGHTRDDQVETVLMHLVRGTGLAGLRGMQACTVWHGPCSSVILVRPLLEATREDTEQYCDAHGLQPRVDFSNYSPAFLRNRLRHRVIPMLRSCNPNIDGALLRTARAAADDLSFIEEQVSSIWDGAVEVQADGVALRKDVVLSLAPSLQRHLLRQVVGELLGDVTNIHSVHIEKMMSALSKPAGKRLLLPRGLVLYVGYDTCLVTTSRVATCPFPFLQGEYALNIPGETNVADWRVTATITGSDGVEGGFAASLDLDATGADLVVRGRRAGDRFQPLGLSQPKKLQDFMVDAKIPRPWRDHIPLVCSPRGIAWVAGWRVAEWAKVSKGTRRVLRLKFEKMG
ncbi:MAG: tRNA lysidine(34) synthetase TilS [Chloroflexota bacterium]